MSELIEDIWEDVRAGLSELGVAMPDGSDPLPDGFTSEPDLRSDAEVNGEAFDMFAWRLMANLTGSLQGIELRGDPITITGVTFVDKDRKHYRRYIDWVHVMRQLGVAFESRPMR